MHALAAQERVLGPDYPDTLMSLNNLAELYAAQYRHGEAEPLLKRALEARERVLGREHPDTLLSVSDLAEVYQDLGRYGEAELLLKRALEARERVLGREHPQTIVSVNDLALQGAPLYPHQPQQSGSSLSGPGSLWRGRTALQARFGGTRARAW